MAFDEFHKRVLRWMIRLVSECGDPRALVGCLLSAQKVKLCPPQGDMLRPKLIGEKGERREAVHKEGVEPRGERSTRGKTENKIIDGNRREEGNI